MRSFAILAGAVAPALTIAQSAQQPDTLKAAADALGAERIETLRFSGSGAQLSLTRNAEVFTNPSLNSW